MTKNKKLSEEQKSQIESTAKETVTIRKANIKQVRPLLEGVSPLVQNAFPKKIEEELASRTNWARSGLRLQTSASA